MYRVDSVRRIVAAGLLCLLGQGWMAALLVSAPQSNLPACCRRNGKHHCGMSQAAGPAAYDSSYAAAAPTCPLYPKTVPKALGGVQLFPFHAQRFLERIAAQKSPASPAVIQYLVSYTPAHPKRGPPHLLSFD
jgi:hypothetical protein